MAKEKRRRFRWKNLKRLLCCCCPFRKKRYTLDECDDGEDNLRGRFTPTRCDRNIDPSIGVAESLYADSTVSQTKPGDNDGGQCGLLQVAKVVKRETLPRETEVINAPVQISEAQIHTTMNCFNDVQERMGLYVRRLCILQCQPNPNTNDIQPPVDILRRYPSMVVHEMSITRRRQCDMNYNGRLVLSSFLHLLCQGNFYHQLIIQTFRNHCAIKYQIIFESAHPGVFSLVFGSSVYITMCSHMSYQVLRSLEYQCNDIGDSMAIAENEQNDNKSNADDDNEGDDRDLKQHNINDNTCGNKDANGKSFSAIHGEKTIAYKDAFIVHNNVSLHNTLPINDKQKKSGGEKYTGISKSCDYTLNIQHANDQMPARSKRNGRIPVKAMMSAASDPPPDDLSQQAQAFARLSITETSILKSRSWSNISKRNHHYHNTTSSSNSNNYRSSIYNTYQFIRGLCNQHCIGAILSVGFMIFVYFAYYLTCCSDRYC